MSRKGFCALALLFIISSGCQPDVNANGLTKDVQSLRLVIPDEGFYRITSQEMRAAGFIVSAADQIQLIFEGEDYPYWSDEPSEVAEFTIRFYVPPAGRYLSEQILILKNKTSSTVIDAPSELQISLKTQSGNHPVQFREVLEPQEIYLSQAGPENPWLWQLIDPRKGVQAEFPLKGEALTGQFLELGLWSPSNAPASPDHAVQAWINDFNLGVFEWEGSGWKTIRIPLNELSLKNSNSIKLEITALKDVIAQKIYLDHVRLEGQKLFTPGKQAVTFYGDGSMVGFEKPWESGMITELDSKTGTVRIAKTNNETGFTINTIKDARYDWLPGDGFIPVKRIESVNWSSDLAVNESALDWLVISPGEYHNSLQPLIALRTAQGLHTRQVDAQQIYDQFYGGSPQPLAFSRFFETINSKWVNFPEYVLLIGDFTYDHQTYDQAITNLPSYFVASAFAGETASDSPLMDLDGDDLPDFVIGRVPVSNREQFTNWVEKLVAFESSAAGFEVDQIISIADNQNEGFATAAQEFLDNFSKDRETTLFQPAQDADTANETVRSFFDGSTDLIAYFGHGSIDMWGNERMFTVKDVGHLSQKEMVPIIINLSCLTGYYIHPLNSSMAEALLFQEDGGSISVIAPTSLTFQTYQSILSTTFSYELQSEKNQRLGDVMKPAWRSMDADNSSSLEVMQTFLLFGDPAMLVHS